MGRCFSSLLKDVVGQKNPLTERIFGLVPTCFLEEKRKEILYECMDVGYRYIHTHIHLSNLPIHPRKMRLKAHI